jgi:hypothetical protein
VLDHDAAGRRRHGDAGVDLLEHRLQAVPKTCRARLRAVAVWKVATIGPLAARQASIDTLGTVGSCTCRTSKSPSRSQRRVRASDSGPNTSRATEPL